jgi:hypothetical protein
MTPDPQRTEERHQDFEIQTKLIAKAVMIMGKIIAPLAGAGLLMLVANHFQQKQMAQDMVRMTNEIKEMRQEATVMSHKIAIMWSGGNWESKYRTSKE